MSVNPEPFDQNKAKSEIKQLVEKYEREKSNNKLESYSEAQVRKDFIDRLFKALGWDVYNEFSNTVTVEEKASNGFVDYGFRINDIPKFFVEAKSFKAGVDRDDYIIQSINYAWSKGCTWAILTNFEKLKVYNAEWKGKSTLESQFLHLHYDKFLEDDWEDLLLLSHENMVKNLLDKKAEKYGKRSTRSPVGRQLFDDLTRFREILTKSIMQRNPQLNLSEESLDESVQKILDRIIFIRTVEDREIEPRKLLPLSRDNHNGNLWKELANLYREFDASYDSKLFSPDKCEELVIGDSELETVIRGLYLPDDMLYYNFRNIDADVLGNVYEQYLGHILQKTKKGATIQDGKAKRKQEGIFYTPNYIVNWIVKNTVGKTVEEMKNDWKKIRILDPACGSGSFLIKALEYLTSLDKEIERQEELKRDLYGTHIPTERFAYLKNNIFGVDLDTKAVEVAQLNLMIQSTEKKERLPLLQQNIRNGNSIIDDPKIDNTKAFPWKSKFPDIMSKGGFDVIIGNPPYVQLSMEENVTDETKNYLLNRYESSMGRLNTFGFFIKLGIELLREGGRLGFIVPNTILTQDYYEELRVSILDSCKIEGIVNFSGLPFKDAVVENTILILRKTKDKKQRDENQVIVYAMDDLKNWYKQKTIIQIDFSKNNKSTFNVLTDESSSDLVSKIKISTEPLVAFLDVNQAIALKHERERWVTKDKSKKNTKPLLVGGKNINRYSMEWDGSYLIYDLEGIHSCKTEDIFLTSEKIIFRRVANRLIGTLDTKQFYGLHTLVVMNLKKGSNQNLKYLLGIFNSKLMTYYYRKVFASTKTVFSEIGARQVEKLPIRITAKEKQELVITLVDQLLNLNKRLSELEQNNTYEKHNLEEEIENKDTELDKIVYDIYDLNDSEREIVNSSKL